MNPITSDKPLTFTMFLVASKDLNVWPKDLSMKNRINTFEKFKIEFSNNVGFLRKVHSASNQLKHL